MKRGQVIYKRSTVDVSLFYLSPIVGDFTETTYVLIFV